MAQRAKTIPRRRVNAGALAGNLSWLAASLPEYRRFNRDAKNLENVQRRRLAHYLKRNADSVFGLEHDFANISSWEEYSERIPIRNYDEFEPWISRIGGGDQHVLSKDPVRLFEPSSGSSGPAKLIPYTQSLQREIRQAVAVWSAGNFLSQPALLSGRAYWSLTPQIKSVQPSESVIPVGFDEDSAYLGGITRQLINRTLVTHPSLSQVGDMETFWRLTLLMLLQCPDLRFISVWHPSFLRLLIQRLRENWTSLIRDLDSGLTLIDVAIPSNPMRAKELATLGCEDLLGIWSELRLISCWTDGHSSSYARQLATLFPGVAIQSKGLVATEAIVTLPFRELRPLAIRSHVFEFLDDDDRALAPWQLEKGGVYTIVVTTGGGLYRYRLGDRVEVEEFFFDVPSLRFLGKDGQVSDFYGEKLNENFVATALQKVFAQNNVDPIFALLAIEETRVPPAYVLYVETESELPESVAQQLDIELRANPHYDLCVKLGQLGGAQVVRVRHNAFDLYTKRLSNMGMRIGDIKPTPLSLHSGWHRFLKIVATPPAAERDRPAAQ